MTAHAGFAGVSGETGSARGHASQGSAVSQGSASGSGASQGSGGSGSGSGSAPGSASCPCGQTVVCLSDGDRQTVADLLADLADLAGSVGDDALSERWEGFDPGVWWACVDRAVAMFAGRALTVPGPSVAALVLLEQCGYCGGKIRDYGCRDCGATFDEYRPV